METLGFISFLLFHSKKKNLPEFLGAATNLSQESQGDAIPPAWPWGVPHVDVCYGLSRENFFFPCNKFSTCMLREENVFRCFCCLSVRNDYSQIYWDLQRRQRYLGSSKLAGIMMQAELVSLRSDLRSKISSVPVRIIYWDLEVAH